MTFFFNKNFWLVTLLLVSMGIAGFATLDYINNNQLNTADASEFNNSPNASFDEITRQRVRSNPSGGLEALSLEELEQFKYFIRHVPVDTARNELNRQLEQDLLTKKQHEQLMQLVDDREVN